MNQPRAVADIFRPYRTHQSYQQLSGEIHKSEVLLITSTLLVVKTKTTFGNSVPHHKEVYWLHHRFYIGHQCTSLWGRTEFPKAVLKAELCFHRYVDFACVPIYIYILPCGWLPYIIRYMYVFIQLAGLGQLG